MVYVNVLMSISSGLLLVFIGYEFYHPFLDESSGLTRAGKYVMPLYQHIVNMRRPTMTFIGVVNKVITKVMDAQVILQLVFSNWFHNKSCVMTCELGRRRINRQIIANC